MDPLTVIIIFLLGAAVGTPLGVYFGIHKMMQEQKRR